MYELDLSQPTVLERGCFYVVEALEVLRLTSEMSARANPKSTTGRLDIFTRLITDNAESFDSVAAGYKGPLYVEVSPRTFSVRLQESARLNQLRFTRGNPRQWVGEPLRELHDQRPLVYDRAGQPLAPDIDDGLWIHIDLATSSDGVVGYRARRDTTLIDLAGIRQHPWQDFWEPLAAAKGRLILTPDEFYILVSSEFVSVPLTHAAELESIATDVGEFRIHYAGFFDPGFGYGAEGEVRGTPAVLEVRSHEVPFLLEHGQTVGRFRYEKLSAIATKPYGTTGSSYHAQRLALAKHFR
jgi:dCTP deaminase